MSEFPKAAEVWEEVSGALIRGLVHALNNRVASIEGIASMMEDDDDATVITNINKEGGRLRVLIESARHIAVESSAEAEAFTLPDLLAATMQLASLHPDLRDLRLDARGAESMPALRLRQRRAEHALVLGVLAASRGGGDELVALCTVTSDDHVEILLRPLKRGSEGSEAHATEALCAAADAMLHGDGGEVELQARAVRSVAFKLPTVKSARAARGREI